MRTEQRKSKKSMLPNALSVSPYNTSICEICQGFGYLRAVVPFGHPQFGKPIMCRCKEAEQAERRRRQFYALSQLEALSEKRLDNYNFRIPGTQEAFRSASVFAHHPEGWLVLLGGPGCGKTHLAAAIGNHCLEQEKVVLFSTTPDLLDHLRSTFAPHSPAFYDQRFALMRQTELLILDDLGMEQATPWVHEKLFQLLDSRYTRQLPTVITMNWRGQESLEESIRSRLADRSIVKTVVLDRVGDYRILKHVEHDSR